MRIRDLRCAQHPVESPTAIVAGCLAACSMCTPITEFSLRNHQARYGAHSSLFYASFQFGSARIAVVRTKRPKERLLR